MIVKNLSTISIPSDGITTAAATRPLPFSRFSLLSPPLKHNLFYREWAKEKFCLMWLLLCWARENSFPHFSRLLLIERRSHWMVKFNVSILCLINSLLCDTHSTCRAAASLSSQPYIQAHCEPCNNWDCRWELKVLNRMRKKQKVLSETFHFSSRLRHRTKLLMISQFICTTINIVCARGEKAATRRTLNTTDSSLPYFIRISIGISDSTLRSLYSRTHSSSSPRFRIPLLYSLCLFFFAFAENEEEI